MLFPLPVTFIQATPPPLSANREASPPTETSHRKKLVAVEVAFSSIGASVVKDWKSTEFESQISPKHYRVLDKLYFSNLWLVTMRICLPLFALVTSCIASTEAVRLRKLLLLRHGRASNNGFASSAAHSRPEFMLWLAYQICLVGA